MIGLKDAAVIARTKFKTKKIRLAIVALASGLVFGMILAATILVTGVADTSNRYAEKTFDGRYFVSVFNDMQQAFEAISVPIVSKPEVKADFEKRQADYIAKRKEAAKRLGVEYDPKTEVEIFIKDPYAISDESMVVNQASPVYQEYIESRLDEYHEVQKKSKAKMVETAKKYGANRIYEIASVPATELTYLKNGQEDLSKVTNPDSFGRGRLADYQKTAVEISAYSIVDDSLLKNYRLPENTKRKSTQGIPVMPAVSDAAMLLGDRHGIAKKIPASATEQRDWQRQAREKLNGETYTVCYRNTAEQTLLMQALQQDAQITKNKDNKEYVKSDLIYKVPDTPCGAVTIKSDTRTAAAKKSAEAEEAFAREFGEYEEPRAELLTFQIVGLLPPPVDYSGSGMTLGGFVKTIMSVNYGMTAMIPAQMLAELPEDKRYDDILDGRSSAVDMRALMDGGMSLVEFGSVTDARRFITEEQCPITSMNCPESRPLRMAPYGSNYMMADEIKTHLLPVFRVIFPFVMLVATIIIWAMVGNVIAESRRETAVFRAIGARRGDIARIYLLYGVMVSLRVAVFAVLLGLALPGILQILFGPDATLLADLAYGINEGATHFSFIGFNWPLLGVIIGSILLMGVIATVPPLVRNVRRNPINDMRDE